VDGISAFDVLAGVLWMMRDLMVLLALVLSVVGLFSRRDWAGAIVTWGLGFLGTVVIPADSDKHGLAGLPESLMIAALAGSTVLLLVGAKRHRSQLIRGRLYRRYPRRASRTFREEGRQEQPDVQTIRATKSEASEPRCPECGAPMVLRVARRGESQGKRFYGCSNFPACRGTRSLE
jgi:hypothetical protein